MSLGHRRPRFAPHPVGGTRPENLLKRQGFVTDAIVTGELASYEAAMKVLGCKDRQPSCHWPV